MNNLPNLQSTKPAPPFFVKEVFFDFEGTLVDFQWQLKPAVEECLTALAKAGFKKDWYGANPSYADIYNHTRRLSMEGKGKGDIDQDLAIVDAIYDKYDADAESRWNLYADTAQALEALRRKGFQLGVVSNIGRAALDAAIKRLHLAHLLGVVISRNEVAQLKPHPGGLIQATQVLRVMPAASVFVGDSRKDVKAARNAGMLAAYLRGGEDAPETMAQDPADIEIDHLIQLPEILTRAP